MLHQNIAPAFRHAIHSWQVADSAALAALVVSAADIGKVALQLSPPNLFMLQDNVTPTWVSLFPTTAIEASGVSIVDAGGYYTATNLEDALAEIWEKLVIKTKQTIAIAIGDETTAITAGTGKVSFILPYNFTVSEIIASLRVPQASGNIFTLDINVNGNSLLTTPLTIDNTENSSITAATPAVRLVDDLSKGAVITIDVDQIGDGTAAGCKVYLVGVPR